MTGNRELDESVHVDPIRPNEVACPHCWLIYNTALSECPTPDCVAGR